MTIKELNKLKIKIKILSVLNPILLLINVLLVAIPFYHYWSIEFTFDTYFAVITLLNTLAFYFQYVTASKLQFFKKKFLHFQNKQLTK